jgi:hypothetical protein
MIFDEIAFGEEFLDVNDYFDIIWVAVKILEIANTINSSIISFLEASHFFLLRHSGLYQQAHKMF